MGLLYILHYNLSVLPDVLGCGEEGSTHALLPPACRGGDLSPVATSSPSQGSRSCCKRASSPSSAQGSNSCSNISSSIVSMVRLFTLEFSLVILSTLLIGKK